MTTIYRFVFDMYPAITPNSEMRFRSLPNINDIPKALLNPTSKIPLPVIFKILFINIFKGLIWNCHLKRLLCPLHFFLIS